MVVHRTDPAPFLYFGDTFPSVLYSSRRQFDRAVSTYSECLRLAPRNATTLCALGFTLQLSRNTSLAIEMYHAVSATHVSKG